MRRSSAAFLATVVVLAGCGGDEKAGTTAAAPPAALPVEAARELVPLASRLIVETTVGPACAAARTASALRAATIRAINDGFVPPRLQEELLGEANALVDAIPCRMSKASDEAGKRALRLGVRLGTLARHGLERARGPLDLRVPSAVVPEHEPRYAVELLYLLPAERKDEATPGQRAVFTLGVLFDEVANGGFAQFFGNEPELVDDVAPSARLIGVESYVSLIEDALDERRRPARLAALDDRMYALWERPGLAPEQVLGAYIKANPAEFFVEPSQ